ESGDDARIVAANRVRRGGLGGFFTKEHFEVVVEQTHAVEAEPTGRRSRTATAARPTRTARREALDATSVLDLVDATNDEEGRHNVVDLAVVERSAGGASAAPRLSTQSEGFQAILERLADNLEPDDDVRVRPGDERGAGDDIEIFDDLTVLEDPPDAVEAVVVETAAVAHVDHAAPVAHVE